MAPRLTGGVVFRQILTWMVLVHISCSPLSFLLEKSQARYKITKRATLFYQIWKALWVLNSPNASTGIYRALRYQVLCKALGIDKH